MQRSDRPNVVFVLTDQQRWDTTGVHGNPLRLTPNFDEFARSGTDVHHSFTCQPVCGPARACLQTGMYATQNGVHRNGLGLPKDSHTIARAFADAGYCTGYIGKWHLSGQEDLIVPPEERHGYDYWLASNVLEFGSLPYSTKLYDNDNQEVFLPGYRIDALTDAAIRKIAEWKDERFFLFVSYLEPHHQNQHDDYPAPDGYSEPYRSAPLPVDLASLGGTSHRHLPGYYGMVRKLDEAFGRIIDALKSLDLSRNTIVAYSSDHGCHFKTRNREYKRSVHDSSLRVPTALNGSVFRGGGRVSSLVSIVDIAPTLLDACGIPVPDTMAGESFLGRLHGKGGDSSDSADELFFQTSEEEIARGIRTHKWKYAVVGTGVDPARDAFSDCYVEAYLYDLEADPFELDNLISLPSHEVLREHLRRRLAHWIERIEKRKPEIQIASRSVGEVQSWAWWQREVREDEIYR